MSPPAPFDWSGWLDEKVAACDRCGRPCIVGPPPNPKARLLRRSPTPEGLCACCAATHFLQTTETLALQLERMGPAVLLQPEVHARFAALMVSGHADAVPFEIDWEAVVENWSLPFPRVRRRSNS